MPTIGWTQASSPLPPPAEPAVVTPVRDAILTTVQRGPLRTNAQPNVWMRGAVYDEHDALVPASQRFCPAGGLWAAADPEKYRGPGRRKMRRLSGRWLYGGHWVQHFGHFMTETLPTLWPQRPALPDVEGLVFHKYLMKRWSVEPWMQRALDMAGHAGLPVEMVGQSNPLVVEHLLVPTRPVVLQGWVMPEGVALWDRVAAARAPQQRRDVGGRVFLTRTLVNAAAREAGEATRTTAERDAALERVFAAHGFEIVAPETLPLEEQLDVVASAGVLAGSTGSALHLSAYAPSTTRVIEVGDSRSHSAPNATQQAIDAGRNRLSAFLPHALDEADLLAAVGDLMAVGSSA